MMETLERKFYGICQSGCLFRLRKFLQSLTCTEEQFLCDAISKNGIFSRDRSQKNPLHYVCGMSPSLDILNILFARIHILSQHVWLVDFNGNSCLHSLCSSYQGDPTSVENIVGCFERIVHEASRERFSDTTSKKRAIQFMSLQNNHGCTALHYLVDMLIDEDITCLILDKALKFSSELASIVDFDGMSLLHYCAQEGISYPVSVYRTILNHYPEIIRLKSKDQKRPIDCLLEAFSEDNPESFEVLSVAIEFEGLAQCWEKVELMLRASCFHNYAKKSLSVEQPSCWLPVHNSARADEFPSSVLRIAVSKYPSQVNEVDEHGQLPLHIAVNAMPDSPSSVVNENVRILVDLHPKALNAVDCRGDSPFCLAILRCKDFEIIEYLLEKNSKLLYQQNPRTKLLPFMMPVQDNTSTDVIDRSFRLLLKDPGVLALLFQQSLEKT